MNDNHYTSIDFLKVAYTHISIALRSFYTIENKTVKWIKQVPFTDTQAWDSTLYLLRREAYHFLERVKWVATFSIIDEKDPQDYKELYKYASYTLSMYDGISKIENDEKRVRSFRSHVKDHLEDTKHIKLKVNTSLIKYREILKETKDKIYNTNDIAKKYFDELDKKKSKLINTLIKLANKLEDNNNFDAALDIDNIIQQAQKKKCINIDNVRDIEDIRDLEEFKDFDEEDLQMIIDTIKDHEGETPSLH